MASSGGARGERTLEVRPRFGLAVDPTVRQGSAPYEEDWRRRTVVRPLEGQLHFFEEGEPASDQPRQDSLF